MNTFKLSLVVLGAVAITACGGGGSDAPLSTPTPPTASSTPGAIAGFPLKAAYNDYLAKSHTYSYGLSGSCPGDGSETISPPAASTFHGAPALVKTSTLRINRGRCTAEGPDLTPVLPPGTETIVSQSFYTEDMVPLGMTIPSDGVTILWTNTTPIPETVKVGDSAVLTHGNMGSISYTVEPESATSVLVKVLTQTPRLDEKPVTMTSTYRLTSGGAFSLVRHEINFDGYKSYILTP